MELIERIKAAIDEDERVANAATPGRWVVGGWRGASRSNVHAPDYRPKGFSNGQHVAETIVAEGGMGPWAADLRGSGFPHANAEHVARHDPARVLRQVAAHRKILEEHDIECPGENYQYCRVCHDYQRHDAQSAPCVTLLALAEVYGIEAQ
jgi:hypothetical protein